jgi:hypothetical protein
MNSELRRGNNGIIINGLRRRGGMASFHVRKVSYADGSHDGLTGELMATTTDLLSPRPRCTQLVAVARSQRRARQTRRGLHGRGDHSPSGNFCLILTAKVYAYLIMLRRACRVSLDFATATKRHEINVLLEAYRGAVNFYIRSLWNNPGKLDGKTLARLGGNHTRLLSMHKDQALKQALTIVSSTRKSAEGDRCRSRSARLHRNGCALPRGHHRGRSRQL